MEPVAVSPNPSSAPLPARLRAAFAGDAVYLAVRWGIVALAAGLRLYGLADRPPHFDEGVNGWFTDQMQKIGYYKYDPTNYHGPLHFYVLFLFKCLLGRDLWALRLPTALVGVLTVDWMFRFDRFFDRRACVWAALAMTVSPSLLYFQRDAIHEAWLVFFLVLGCWGVCGLWQEGARRHLWATGMALAGMILTKETYIIHLGCLFIAGACVAFVELAQPSRRAFFSPLTPLPPPPAPAPLPLDGEEERPPAMWTLPPEPSLWPEGWGATCAPQRWRSGDLWAVVAVGMFLVLFFYSGNGFSPAGIEGLVTSFKYWGHKSQEGEGHNKPFIYWWKLIARNEPWAFGGLLACLRYAVPALPGTGGRWRWVGAAVLAAGLGVLAVQGLFLFDFGAWWPGVEETRSRLVTAVPFLRREGVEWGIAVSALVWAAVGTSLLALPAPGDWRMRLIAVYGFGTLLAYCLIPYKTPWCIISMLWPFFLVAGALLAEWSDAADFGSWLAAEAVMFVGAAATVVSGWLALDLNYRRPTDDKLDYVYVQSFNDVWTVVNPMLEAARRDPTFLQSPGVILCGSTYPLPWLLGDFTHIGYYADNNKPPLVGDYRVDFLLVVDKRVAETEVNLADDYYKQTVHLRPALDGMQLYLRASRFKALMPPGRAPEFHPLPAAEEEAAPDATAIPPLGKEPLPVKVEDED